MKQRIEVVANIAIIVFLVSIGVLYFVSFLRSRPKTSAVPNEVKVGEQLAALPGYNWRSHAHTLVLALRYGCHYCEESAPFYRHLLNLQAGGQFGDLRIIANLPG